MFSTQLFRLLQYVWRHPLNAGHRSAAIWRLVRWQIASRLMDGPIALPYVEDTFLFASRGMTGATGNWYCGLHEVSEMAFVLHLIRPGEHFADVGANIGSYSILAAGGAQARVTAIEPIPATVVHLQRNVDLNGLNSKINVRQQGLSNTGGKIRFTRDLDTVNHVVAAGEDCATIEVEVRTMDEIFEGDAPALLKIDVEGHELAVLEGGSKTLSQADLLAVILETNGSGGRYGVGDVELMRRMESHGFSPFVYDPFSRRLLESSGTELNTIFVRDRLEVERRTQGAKRFRLLNGSI